MRRNEESRAARKDQEYLERIEAANARAREAAHQASEERSRRFWQDHERRNGR
jgi:hypothetical protein